MRKVIQKYIYILAGLFECEIVYRCLPTNRCANAMDYYWVEYRTCQFRALHIPNMANLLNTLFKIFYQALQYKIVHIVIK